MAAAAPPATPETIGAECEAVLVWAVLVVAAVAMTVRAEGITGGKLESACDLAFAMLGLVLLLPLALEVGRCDVDAGGTPGAGRNPPLFGGSNSNMNRSEAIPADD